MHTELFLTGATGFIGSSLLQKWLDCSDARITILVRPKRGEEPQQRAQRLLDQLYPADEAKPRLQRVVVIEGDLTQNMLGMTRVDYERLASRTTRIIHCGAAARFDLPLEAARQTNCGGARGVLDLAARTSGLRRMDYIGTAYVAGKRRGLIREEELNEGQAHNNTYEQSKLEAEQLVRQAMAELPISIFRPTIVLGDSRTGRVSPVSAFSRVLGMYAQGQLQVLPGDSSASMDLIPLDYATDAMYSISQNAQSIGKCFHVSAGIGNGTTLDEIADLASQHFDKERFAIISPEDFERQVTTNEGNLSDEERETIGEIRLYLPYLTGDWQFDDSNTRDALAGTDLKVPKVVSYFGKMVEYIAGHR